VQVDDAILPMHYNPHQSVESYLKWAAVRVEALNHALSGIPPDRVRYHMCWGSQNAPHTWDLPLEKIVKLLLTINAGAYSLEAANPRHEHEYRIWEDVKLPEDKLLVPGVVSHCTNVVEHPELVALRISKFAEIVGRERVIAGTDCGFSQFWNLIRVHPEVQWAKLNALVEGARLASRRLWAKSKRGLEPAPV
jgi:5-methyltetrahydropteroyltriglutamate--homocysteine methyltransferase